MMNSSLTLLGVPVWETWTLAKISLDFYGDISEMAETISIPLLYYYRDFTSDDDDDGKLLVVLNLMA